MYFSSIAGSMERNRCRCVFFNSHAFSHLFSITYYCIRLASALWLRDGFPGTPHNPPLPAMLGKLALLDRVAATNLRRESVLTDWVAVSFRGETWPKRPSHDRAGSQHPHRRARSQCRHPLRPTPRRTLEPAVFFQPCSHSATVIFRCVFRRTGTVRTRVLRKRSIKPSAIRSGSGVILRA